jgi:RNA polymerase sigma-70 factor (ECF subfamily)
VNDRLPEIAPTSGPTRNGEESLVARARSGEPEALGTLFVTHATATRRLLRSVLGPDDELDDLVQEVFLQVHRSIRGFRGDSGFSTWLHRLTVNTAVSHLRSRARRRSRLEAAPPAATPASPGPAPDERASAREMLRRLYAILEEMPIKRRVAFTLFELEGLSLERLADVLGVSIQAAKSRVFFARRELLARAAADPLLAALKEEIES